MTTTGTWEPKACTMDSHYGRVTVANLYALAVLVLHQFLVRWECLYLRDWVELGLGLGLGLQHPNPNPNDQILCLLYR